MVTNQKLIHNLLSICLKINENEKYESFFNYHGHVEQIGIYINLKGTHERVYDEYFYLDIIKEEFKTPEQIIEELMDKFITPIEYNG